MRHWRLFIVAVCLLAAARQDSPAADDSMWAISIGGDSPPTILTGRILAEIPGSALLIEERNGRQHQLTEAKIKSRTELSQAFALFTPEELAADLLQQVPAGFEIAETDHYVLCSNSSSDYVDFCGRLLESVFSQYFRFMTELRIPVQQPSQKLPVVIFASAAEFQAFALQQHPEISFADTPEYFSVSDNQTLLLDLTGDRSIRSRASIRRVLAEKPLQVATVVHEAVHQLSFNSGLQVRMADNPLWISEGLAMYFETTSLRSTWLWSRPGLVNPRHQPAFVQLAQGHQVSGGITTVIASDAAFLNASEMAAAYAKAWALTHYLFRENKTGMQAYFQRIAQRRPMVGLTAEERIQEFRDAFGKSPDEMEKELVSYIRRQRVSR